MNKHNFGKFLETLRKERDLTQKQVVEQIKTNKKSKKKLISIIAILLTIAILVSGYITLAVSGVFDGVIRRKLYNCSKEALVVLDSIERDAIKYSKITDWSYKRGQSNTGELYLENFYITIKPDQTTTRMVINGITEKGTKFSYDVRYETEEENGYATVIQTLAKDNPQAYSISAFQLRNLLSQLDLSSFGNFDNYYISLIKNNLFSLFHYTDEIIAEDTFAAKLEKADPNQEHKEHNGILDKILVFDSEPLYKYDQRKLNGFFYLIKICCYSESNPGKNDVIYILCKI